MTIASEITRINNNIASAYTAASGKGATLPATQNSANLANCISSISLSGTKYGAIAGSFLGDIGSDDFLQRPSVPTDLVFTGAKDIATNALYYKFYQNTGITSASFPDLEEVSKASAMYYAFNGCTSLTSVSFPKLKTVSGQNAMYYIFVDCTSLTTALLPELTTVSGTNGIVRLFYNCSSLTSLSLPKLATLSANSCAQYILYGTAISTMTFTVLSDVSGNGCLRYAFGGCKNLTSVSFPALKTTSFGSEVNQFQGIFNSNTASTSGAFTVHFPSNLQSTISGLTGYPTFGATAGRITLLFDLTATS